MPQESTPSVAGRERFQRPLAELCCVNLGCPDRGKRNVGNLSIRAGKTVVPPRTGKPGRPRQPFKQWPQGPVYATVNKTYRKGRGMAVARKLVYGTEAELAQALESSPVSDQVNTAFMERQNGTDRTHNARKARKSYEFSKDFLGHVAVTWWV